MIAKKRIHLNLASHPARNRRLFFILVGLLGGAFLLTAVSGGIIYVKYGLQSQKIGASRADLDGEIRKIQREERRYTTQIEQLAVENREKVDLINGIIYQKTFSWADLLTQFERALPDGCYLVSLVPQVRDDLNLELRFKFACQDMKGLLEMVNRLRSMRFSNIRLVNETRDDTGRYLYELAVRYERAG